MDLVGRPKRVTYRFHERVKDRLAGREPAYVSSGSNRSGSNHSEDCTSNDGVPSSPSLSCLLHRFLEENNETEAGADEDDDEHQSRDADLDSDSDRMISINEIMISTMRNQNADRLRNVLFERVLKAMEIFHCVRPNGRILNRNVMLFLQNLGYNAAICKTKWQSSAGVTAGNHEFLDVVVSGSGARYFIDLSFSGEFVIARQTDQLRQLWRNLPEVFVGKSEDLKVIVKLMSNGVRRSMKSRGLPLPPWRKHRFMLNKWFGPYRRTVNYIPGEISSSITVPADVRTSVVKCRSIGFNVVDGPPLLPAATRTK